MNWFVLVVGILQLGATAVYFYQGSPKLASLMFLYSLSNFVICTMRG